MAARVTQWSVTHLVSEYRLDRGRLYLLGRVRRRGGWVRCVLDRCGDVGGRCDLGGRRQTVRRAGIGERCRGHLSIDVILHCGFCQVELQSSIDCDAPGGFRKITGAVWWNLRKLVTVEVLHTERPEDVVDDGIRHLDVRMALNDAAWLERLEGERVDILLERHAVLEALAHRNGEASEDAPQRRALLGEIEEDLAKRAIGILTGT